MQFTKNFHSFISENYASLGETQRLWKNSNGKVNQIQDQQSSQVRWHQLLTQAEAGAIHPELLIMNALKDFPFNKILLEELMNWVPQTNMNLATQYLEAKNEPIRHQFESLSGIQAASAITTVVVNELTENDPQLSNTPLNLKEKFIDALMSKGIDIATTTAVTGWGLILQQLIS
ncbi:hypothetical protein [Acinetobacter pittii]|uniref:hypothetical protein n=1 Tax=Acinetobacter pittii TaxID=48296 RepID=UPI00192BD741|nr:hypothetical protein [Acinetobacter pittii]